MNAPGPEIAGAMRRAWARVRGGGAGTFPFLPVLFIASVVYTRAGVFINNHAIHVALVKLLNDPSLYPGDPFAETLTRYPSVLWHLVAVLARLAPLGPLLLVLFLLERLLVLYAARRLAGAFAPGSELAAVGAMALVGFAIRPLLGAGTIVKPYFEQTGLAIAFLLLASAAFHERRHVAWAVWTALAFDATSMYGSFALGYFALALLLDERHRGPWRPWARAGALCAVLSAPGLLLTLRALGRPLGDAQVWLAASRMRLWRHLVPTAWHTEVFLTAAALLVLLLVLVAYGDRPFGALQRHALIWSAGGALCLSVSFVAASLRSPSLLMLQPARGTDLWVCFAAVATAALAAGRVERAWSESLAAAGPTGEDATSEQDLLDEGGTATETGERLQGEARDQDAAAGPTGEDATSEQDLLDEGGTATETGERLQGEARDQDATSAGSGKGSGSDEAHAGRGASPDEDETEAEAGWGASPDEDEEVAEDGRGHAPDEGEAEARLGDGPDEDEAEAGWGDDPGEDETAPLAWRGRTALLAFAGAVLLWRPVGALLVAACVGLGMIPAVWTTLFAGGRPRRLAGLLALWFCLAAAWRFQDRAMDSGLLGAIVDRPAKTVRDIAAWAKASTAKDAVFLVELKWQSDWGQFRALSERPIYTDWEDGGAMTWSPDFALEWVRRFELFGFDVRTRRLRNDERLGRLYDRLKDSSVEKLRKEVPFRYWVVDKKHVSGYPAVFSAGGSKVLDLEGVSVLP